MSLHIFIKGSAQLDFGKMHEQYDKAFYLGNHTYAQQQVDYARQHWLSKNSQQRVAVVTNSEFFIKEINTLISVCKLLSNEQLDKFIAEFPVYTKELFVDRSINITCYCMTLQEDCELNDFGFKPKLIDEVIEFQNQVQDALYWNDY